MYKKENLVKNKKGFTLVELLIVISIIAILAAVVAPSAFSSIEKSKGAALLKDVEAIKTASFIFYADTGVFPNGTVSGGQPYSVWNKDSRSIFITGDHVNKPSSWDGPYLDSWPDKTPFGGCYTYRYLHTGSGGSLSWATANLVKASDLITEFPNKNTEVVYIRFNHDADKEKKREKVLELLRKQINPELLYVIKPTDITHDQGLIVIVLR